MPLQKQPEQVIPIRGLNAHIDPKSAQPGDLDIAENVWFRRAAVGGVEARKRFGVTSLTRNIFGGGTISAGAKLGVFDDQRLMTDGSKLYSYSTILASWVSMGATTPLGIRAEKVAGDVVTRSLPMAAVGGNLLCFLQTSQTNGTHASVIDTQTGVILLNDFYIGSGGSSFRHYVVALATRFVIIVVVPGGGNVQAFTIDYATPATVGGPTVVVSDLGASGNCAVTRNGANDSLLLAYHSTAANHLKIQIVNSNLTLGSVVGNTDVPDQAMGWLNWDFSNGKGYLAYVGAASGAKLLDVQQSALSITATTTVDAAITACRNITGYRSGSTPVVLLDVASGVAPCFTKIRRWPGSGSTSLWQAGMGLTSNVFKSGSKYVVAASYQSAASGTGQNTYFLLDPTGTSPVILGKVLYGLAGALNANTCCLPDPPALSSTVSAVPVTRFSFDPGGGGSLVYDAYYLRVDFAAALSPYKRCGDSLLLTGASVRQFDGAITTECGHCLYPEITSFTGAAGGSLTASAVYQLTACYVWTDHRGQIHRSPISPPQTVTLTAGQNTVNFTIAYSRIGDKPAFNPSGNNMYLEVYLTAGNGQTFYRVANVLNDPATDSISSSYNQADTAITAGIQLYTTGGMLPHIPPPPAILLEIFQNRPVLAGTENPLELWIGNEYQAGKGPSFSDALVITMESEGGAITGIAECGGRLAIFKRSRIYLMAGAGPSLTGAGQFDQPTLLTPQVGATSTAGIAKTNDGVIFKSEKGTYLLPNGGGQPVRLGNVETFDSLNLTASTTAEGYEHVRLFTDSGRTLVYHFGIKDEQGLGLWSTYTGQAAVDAITWNGKVAYLDANGTVKEEIAGQWADDGAAITEKVRWARLNLAGLFGRLKFYGLRVLTEIMASITASLTTDITVYGQTISETDTLAVTTATQDPIAARPAQARAETLQVTFQETSTTEGFRVTALGLEVAVKPGAGKQPQGQFAS